MPSKYIHLDERLKPCCVQEKIFTYTGKNKFEKDKVHPSETIIVTNIVGLSCIHMQWS
jgi:hypothetical protein